MYEYDEKIALSKELEEDTFSFDLDHLLEELEWGIEDIISDMNKDPERGKLTCMFHLGTLRSELHYFRKNHLPTRSLEA